MNLFDLQKMSAGVLLDQLITCATEKGVLIGSNAPDEELRTVQQKIDIMQEESLRRMSW